MLHGTRLAGAVGPLPALAQFRKWTDAGCVTPFVPVTDAQLVIVTPDKGLIRYKDSATPYLHGHNTYAMGEGAPFAYGALFMGATAEQAVAAAIHNSPHCNGHVVSLSL